MAEAFEHFDSGIVPATGLGAIPDLATASEAQKRTRDLYSVEEVAAIDRAAKILTKHGDKMRLRCGAQLCPSRAIELVNEATAERGAVLRCGCTDRVFERDKLANTKQAKAAARRLRRGQLRVKHG